MFVQMQGVDTKSCKVWLSFAPDYQLGTDSLAYFTSSLPMSQFTNTHLLCKTPLFIHSSFYTFTLHPCSCFSNTQDSLYTSHTPKKKNISCISDSSSVTWRGDCWDLSRDRYAPFLLLAIFSEYFCCCYCYYSAITTLLLWTFYLLLLRKSKHVNG